MRQSFPAWKLACSAHAMKLLSLSDLWTEDDPYDLADAAQAAFDSHQSPRAFIEEMFAEDIARQEYDAQLAAEALEQEDEEP